VYGVALGTLFVFIVTGALFMLNLPGAVQKWREARSE
jgi:hypothetical protein